jgi:hypothetical protein
MQWFISPISANPGAPASASQRLQLGKDLVDIPIGIGKKGSTLAPGHVCWSFDGCRSRRH